MPTKSPSSATAPARLPSPEQLLLPTLPETKPILFPTEQERFVSAAKPVRRAVLSATSKEITAHLLRQISPMICCSAQHRQLLQNLPLVMSQAVSRLPQSLQEHRIITPS